MPKASPTSPGLVLAQVKVSEKSNEITAIPALLEMRAIEGAVITIDAHFNNTWGCQRDIAAKIIANKADCILALKGNQTTLHEDVELFIGEQKAKAFADTVITTHETVDAGHGRVEARKYTAIHNVAWLQARHKWPVLKGLLMVESQRDKDTRKTRLYITSLSLNVKLAGPTIRDQRGIENALHWVMDMTFHDDERRIRTEHAPANFTTLRHIAHNLYRKAPGKDSIRLRRKAAAWDDDFLVSLIAA
jgi:predicted transposase YbfD/YdcC